LDQLGHQVIRAGQVFQDPLDLRACVGLLALMVFKVCRVLPDGLEGLVIQGHLELVDNLVSLVSLVSRDSVGKLDVQVLLHCVSVSFSSLTLNSAKYGRAKSLPKALKLTQGISFALR